MSSVATYDHKCEGKRFIGDSQVTLQSVIVNWQRGASPERIQESFPSLPLVAIYGAITYYLEHQTELDAHFQETHGILAAHQASVEAEHPEFFADLRTRLDAHRAQRGEEWHEELAREG